MAYKDKERRNQYQRILMRTKRHPDWRQVFLDCNGMCVFRDENGSLCGSVDALEFHEVWIEAKAGENKFQQRVLVCNFHHFVEHVKDGFVGKVNPRPWKNKLQADVEFEMKRYGGLEGWVKHYGLIHRDGDATPECGGYDATEYESEYRETSLEGAHWE